MTWEHIGPALIGAIVVGVGVVFPLIRKMMTRKDTEDLIDLKVDPLHDKVDGLSEDHRRLFKLTRGIEGKLIRVATKLDVKEAMNVTEVEKED